MVKVRILLMDKGALDQDVPIPIIVIYSRYMNNKDLNNKMI